MEMEFLAYYLKTVFHIDLQIYLKNKVKIVKLFLL